jgi:ribosomal protein L24E
MLCRIMTNRVCSYCGSNTEYDSGHWYSLATHDRKCLYFLCINCYSKQTQWTHARKVQDIKQGSSKLKSSLLQKIILKSIESK